MKLKAEIQICKYSSQSFHGKGTKPLKIFLKGNNKYECKKSGKSFKEKENIGG